MEESASEAELNALRIPGAGICWWCGDKANTREHKFKLSDLRRMSTGSSEPLVWGDDKTLANIRSLRKSDRVKFSPNLCSNCNNARSQKFDYAYEKFSDYVWSRRGSLWRSRFMDMGEIYGDEWQGESLDLARYIVKHAGCRIADDGFAVPNGFGEFLDGGELLSHFHVCVFKHPDVYRAQRRISGRNGDPLGLWIGAMAGRVSREKAALTAFGSTLSVGFIGFVYRWYVDVPETDPFYKYRMARIHRLDRIPAL
ncbi:hypothetical protein ACTU45_14925 [Streptomyces sp. 24-1644]|uniref:hypothetical protein n=1 Tax=Streptomyces sp. 24-1644 TaxID=3457315 RepID=UPI003FA7A3CC